MPPAFSGVNGVPLAMSNGDTSTVEQRSCHSLKCGSLFKSFNSLISFKICSASTKSRSCPEGRLEVRDGTVTDVSGPLAMDDTVMVEAEDAIACVVSDANSNDDGDNGDNDES